jgi:hypothetical protein
VWQTNIIMGFQVRMTRYDASLSFDAETRQNTVATASLPNA